MTLPWFGVANKTRSREAEALERSARSLNEVAGQIEAAAAGGADPEYIRKLEKIYYQMYLSRPR